MIDTIVVACVDLAVRAFTFLNVVSVVTFMAVVVGVYVLCFVFAVVAFTVVVMVLM
jgi:hypothetical protein